MALALLAIGTIYRLRHSLCTIHGIVYHQTPPGVHSTRGRERYSINSAGSTRSSSAPPATDPSGSGSGRTWRPTTGPRWTGVGPGSSRRSWTRIRRSFSSPLSTSATASWRTSGSTCTWSRPGILRSSPFSIQPRRKRGSYRSRTFETVRSPLRSVSALTSRGFGVMTGVTRWPHVATGISRHGALRLRRCSCAI